MPVVRYLRVPGPGVGAVSLHGESAAWASGDSAPSSVYVASLSGFHPTRFATAPHARIIATAISRRWVVWEVVNRFWGIYAKSRHGGPRFTIDSSDQEGLGSECCGVGAPLPGISLDGNTLAWTAWHCVQPQGNHGCRYPATLLKVRFLSKGGARMVARLSDCSAPQVSLAAGIVAWGNESGCDSKGRSIRTQTSRPD